MLANNKPGGILGFLDDINFMGRWVGNASEWIQRELIEPHRESVRNDGFLSRTIQNLPSSILETMVGVLRAGTNLENAIPALFKGETWKLLKEEYIDNFGETFQERPFDYLGLIFDAASLAGALGKV